MPVINSPPPGDYTSAEAMAELHAGEKKYWNLINTSELEAYYLGTQIRITRKSLEDYKKRHRYVPRKQAEEKVGAA